MPDTPIRVSVFKRPSRANYEAQWVDPLSGKTKMKSTGHKVRREAERWAGRWEKELNDDAAGTARVTWRAFRERAERDLLPTLRDATASKHRTTMDKVETHLRPKLLTEITPEKIGRLTEALRNEPGHGGRTKSPASVAGNLRHLKALLNWAFRQGMIPRKPIVEIPRGEVAAKGRPLTKPEFARLLRATRAVCGHERGREWRRLLRGLWLSGLRLSEAMAATWDDADGVRVRLDGPFPAIFIPGRMQKGRKDTVTPLTPDFVAFLSRTPETKRTGPVFTPETNRGPADNARAGVVIGRIGAEAGVEVKKGKTATAQDLRLSFCFRWAQKVLPQHLRALARHQNVTTTLQFYAESDAAMTAEALAAVVAAG